MLSRIHRSKHRRGQKSTTILAIERLEDRWLLASILWTGNGDDNRWGNSGNWNGPVPGPDDTAVFTGSATVGVDRTSDVQGKRLISGMTVDGNVTFVSAGGGIEIDATGADAPGLKLIGSSTLTTSVGIEVSGPDPGHAAVTGVGTLIVQNANFEASAFGSGRAAIDMVGELRFTDSRVKVHGDAYEATPIVFGGDLKVTRSTMTVDTDFSGSFGPAHVKFGDLSDVNIALVDSTLSAYQLTLGGVPGVTRTRVANVTLTGKSSLRQADAITGGTLSVRKSSTVQVGSDSAVFYGSVSIAGKITIDQGGCMQATESLTLTATDDTQNPASLVNNGYVAIRLFDELTQNLWILHGRIDVYHQEFFHSPLSALWSEGAITTSELYIHDWRDDPVFYGKPGGAQVRLAGELHGNLINGGNLEFADTDFWNDVQAQIGATGNMPTALDPLLTIYGNYEQLVTGILKIQSPLDSYRLDADWSPLVITGNATLGGTLVAQLRYKHRYTVGDIPENKNAGAPILEVLRAGNIPDKRFVGFVGATTDPDISTDYKFDERGSAEISYDEPGKVILKIGRYEHTDKRERPSLIRTYPPLIRTYPPAVQVLTTREFTTRENGIEFDTIEFNTQEFRIPSGIAFDVEIARLDPQQNPDHFDREAWTPATDADGNASRRDAGGTAKVFAAKPGWYDVRIRFIVDGVQITKELARMQVRFPYLDEMEQMVGYRDVSHNMSEAFALTKNKFIENGTYQEHGFIIFLNLSDRKLQLVDDASLYASGSCRWDDIDPIDVMFHPERQEFIAGTEVQQRSRDLIAICLKSNDLESDNLWRVASFHTHTPRRGLPRNNPYPVVGPSGKQEVWTGIEWDYSRDAVSGDQMASLNHDYLLGIVRDYTADFDGDRTVWGLAVDAPAQDYLYGFRRRTTTRLDYDASHTPKVNVIEENQWLISPYSPLDVNADRTVNPSSDGTLLVRYLAGFRGDPLIAGAASGSGDRNAEEIAAHLEFLRDVMLDVDGDGQYMPLSDGILFGRFLAGFTGNALTHGAVSTNATRSSAESIVGFLDQFLATPDPNSDSRSGVAASVEGEASAASATQVFTPTVAVIGDSVTFDVVYSALDDSGAQDHSIKTTGVSIRMHYDSKEVTPNIAAIQSSAYAGATIQDSDDTWSDFDADPATDRFVNFLWFDLDTQFPAKSDLPLTLFSAHFDPVTTLDDVPIVKFSGSPPPGFELRFGRVTDVGPWTNPMNRFDVDGDGGVLPQDVLDLINYVNAHTPDLTLPAPPDVPPSRYYDVNDDGACTAQDVLMVINYINSQPMGSGEGEAFPFFAPVFALERQSPIVPRAANGRTSVDDEPSGYHRAAVHATDDDADGAQRVFPDTVWDDGPLEELDAAFAELEALLPDIAHALTGSAGTQRR